MGRQFDDKNKLAMPPHLAPVVYTCRLPAWLAEKLRRSDFGGKWLENLILKETGWEPPNR